MNEESILARIKWRIRADQAELENRVGVATNKPCSGCGRSWKACGGGWVDPVEGTDWTCNACMPPVDYCSCAYPACRNRIHEPAEKTFARLSGRRGRGVDSV